MEGAVGLVPDGIKPNGGAEAGLGFEEDQVSLIRREICG